MKEDYKHLYEAMQKILYMYQNEIVPGYRKKLEDTKEKCVEVVRCKDCIGKEHWYKNDYGCTICGLSGFFVVEDNDFCSYGERKDNGVV